MFKQTFVAIALGLALTACDKSEQDRADRLKTDSNPPQTEMAATVSQAEIKVPTIQCKSCKANVEEALKALDGIQSATVNLDKKITQVSFDSRKTNLTDMEKAIVMAGYDANDTKRDPQAYADLDACCKLLEDRAKK